MEAPLARLPRERAEPQAPREGRVPRGRHVPKTRQARRRVARHRHRRAPYRRGGALDVQHGRKPRREVTFDERETRVEIERVVHPHEAEPELATAHLDAEIPSTIPLAMIRARSLWIARGAIRDARTAALPVGHDAVAKCFVGHEENGLPRVANDRRDEPGGRAGALDDDP